MSKGREIDEETILLEMQPGAGSEEPVDPVSLDFVLSVMAVGLIWRVKHSSEAALGKEMILEWNAQLAGPSDYSDQK